MGLEVYGPITSVKVSCLRVRFLANDFFGGFSTIDVGVGFLGRDNYRRAHPSMEITSMKITSVKVTSMEVTSVAVTSVEVINRVGVEFSDVEISSMKVQSFS